MRQATGLSLAFINAFHTSWRHVRKLHRGRPSGAAESHERLCLDSEIHLSSPAGDRSLKRTSHRGRRMCEAFGLSLFVTVTSLSLLPFSIPSSFTFGLRRPLLLHG